MQTRDESDSSESSVDESHPANQNKGATIIDMNQITAELPSTTNLTSMHHMHEKARFQQSNSSLNSKLVPLKSDAGPGAKVLHTDSFDDDGDSGSKTGIKRDSEHGSKTSGLSSSSSFGTNIMTIQFRRFRAKFIKFYYEKVSFKVESLLMVFTLSPFLITAMLTLAMNSIIFNYVLQAQFFLVGLVLIGLMAIHSISFISRRLNEVKLMGRVVHGYAKAG